MFAQRGNLARPRFWGMLADLLRFNRLCTRLAQAHGRAGADAAAGRLSDQHRFGDAFRDWYLLPMLGCI